MPGGFIPFFLKGWIEPRPRARPAIGRAPASVAARLGQFLSVTHDAIVAVDRNWCFSYLNETALKTYSADGRELLGKKLWDEFPDTVYEGSPYVEHYNRAMYEGASGSFEAHYPEPLNIWIQIEVYPTPDGIVTFSRDINARKKAEAALLLSEKLAAVGRLASSISHEINNPLEAVTNLLFLARGSSQPWEIHEYLDQADQELRRVSIITNQTLRFRKQNSGPQPIHSAELFTGVLSLLEGKIKNAGVIVQRRDRAHKPIKVFEGDIR